MVLVVAVRHVGGGEIRNDGQRVPEIVFQFALFLLALLDRVLEIGDFLHQVAGGVFILFRRATASLLEREVRLGLADELGGFVAARLLHLEIGQQIAQRLVARQQIGGHGAGGFRIGRAALQRRDKCVRVVPDGLDVVHESAPAKGCVMAWVPTLVIPGQAPRSGARGRGPRIPRAVALASLGPLPSRRVQARDVREGDDNYVAALAASCLARSRSMSQTQRIEIS